MFYSNYYWGMNPIWWIIWMIMIVWIFAIPYDIPGERKQKDTPLDILQQRYALGQMTTEEYKERKRIITEDMAEIQRTVNSNKHK